MTALRYAGVYLLTFAVFIVVDLVWLSTVALKFYTDNIGASRMQVPPIWPVAIAFYLLYVAGVLVVVSIPAAHSGDLWKAVLFGALFGLCAYATYDLTNWSTLKDWPAIVSLVDMVWGTTLTAIVATAGYFITRWLGA
jgi:uncharacterized membrane protein